eukprot:5869096-Alexandrium_andersonii.AAC.1
MGLSTASLATPSTVQVARAHFPTQAHAVWITRSARLPLRVSTYARNISRAESGLANAGVGRGRKGRRTCLLYTSPSPRD